MTATATMSPRHAGDSWQDDPDVRLMLRVRDGDNDSFGELVRRYRQRVLNYFRRGLIERSETEDLTQEVFLRVYRHRQRYSPCARFASWIFFIARNVASNARRTRRRSPQVQLNTTTSEEHRLRPAAAELPLRTLVRDELASAVRTAVAGLGGRKQIALELYQFQDRSCAEVAEVLQMTPKGAKSLLFRARQELRAALVSLLG